MGYKNRAVVEFGIGRSGGEMSGGCNSPDLAGVFGGMVGGLGGVRLGVMHLLVVWP